jgi:hypothetical protein
MPVCTDDNAGAVVNVLPALGREFGARRLLCWRLVLFR